MRQSSRLSLILLAFSVTAPVAASAQDFPNTLNMTCAQATAMVNSQGAVTLSTGPNIFNRYVKDAASCTADQVTKEQWVQTSDQQQCAIGSTCVDPSNLGGGR